MAQEIEGRREGRLSARLVAEQRQGRRDLGAREGALEDIELRVGRIAQIPDDRAMVARQHIGRIGEAVRVLGLEVGVVHDEVAQAVERRLEADLRHVEIPLARPRQEIGREGVEPDIVGGILRPQAEGAVRGLARHHPLDRVLDAVVDIGIDAEPLARGELVDIEERHGARHGLLGAAVRIAVERLQQGRDVDRHERRDRDADRAGRRQELREQVLRDREARLRRHRPHDAPVERGPSGLDPAPRASG